MARTPRSGRPVKYGPSTMTRVQRDQLEQVQAVLWPWENQADFMRLAVKKELQVRDKIKKT